MWFDPDTTSQTLKKSTTQITRLKTDTMVDNEDFATSQIEELEDEMEQKYSKEELETAIRDAIEKEVPQWKIQVEEHAKTENELREQLKVAGVFQSKVEGLVTQVKKEQEQNSELQMQIEILSSYAAQIKNVEELEKKVFQDQKDF